MEHCTAKIVVRCPNVALDDTSCRCSDHPLPAPLPDDPTVSEAMACAREPRVVEGVQGYQLALALRAAHEYVLSTEKDHPEAAALVMPVIEPVAVHWCPDLGRRRFPIELLHADATSLALRGRAPHWAMREIARSLAESMLDAPNYQTCVLTTGQADGPRFECTLRQIGKGRTAHELRVEVEHRLARAEKALDAVADRAQSFCAKPDARTSVDDMAEAVVSMGDVARAALADVRTVPAPASKVDWRSMTPAEVFDALREAPLVAKWEAADMAFDARGRHIASVVGPELALEGERLGHAWRFATHEAAEAWMRENGYQLVAPATAEQVAAFDKAMAELAQRKP